jgi:hypothetical protein
MLNNYPEFLLPVDLEDLSHENYTKAVGIVFDANDDLMYEFSEKDLIYMPEISEHINKKTVLNTFQWISYQEDLLYSILAYLFTEPTPKKRLRYEFYKHLKKTYTFEIYIERIEYFLFLKKGSLKDFYPSIKRIFDYQIKEEFTSAEFGVISRTY